jgi:hypothetical protein
MGYHQLFYGQDIKMENFLENRRFIELTKPNGAKVTISKKHISFLEPRHDGSTYLKTVDNAFAIKEKYIDLIKILFRDLK